MWVMGLAGGTHCWGGLQPAVFCEGAGCGFGCTLVHGGPSCAGTAPHPPPALGSPLPSAPLFGDGGSCRQSPGSTWDPRQLPGAADTSWGGTCPHWCCCGMGGLAPILGALQGMSSQQREKARTAGVKKVIFFFFFNF